MEAVRDAGLEVAVLKLSSIGHLQLTEEEKQFLREGNEPTPEETDQ